MTATTSGPKYRTITLTDRAPVRIVEDQWPTLAHGCWSDHDNQYEFQANRKWRIDVRLRQHEDGRAIVYAIYDYDTAFQSERNENHKVGMLLEAAGDYPTAIKQVAQDLIDRVSDDDMHRHIREAANECIADLPAQDL